MRGMPSGWRIEGMGQGVGVLHEIRFVVWRVDRYVLGLAG
jgi:hypothetical protein